MPSLRLVNVLLFGIALGIATTAAAQAQPKLEILMRQGDFYWVVETAPDGTRRGGWVNVQMPLDRIDRSTFKLLPGLGETPPAPQGQEDAASVNERLAKIEQALATGQRTGPDAVAPQPEVARRPAPLRQVVQPRPQGITSVGPRPQTREGFWFNGGLGLGVAGCVGCVGREVGSSGGLSLGGTISERVLLGVGTTGWYKNVDGVVINGGTLDARIRFYPSLASGFFLTGGGGLGTISVRNVFSTASETGAGALFGLGWDVRVTPNVSVTPFYNGFAVGVTSGTFFVDQFGVGITIH